jgi:hypothetical protein
MQKILSFFSKYGWRQRCKQERRHFETVFLREYIQKFPDWVDNEINNNNNKHSLRSNTKGYGGKIYYTDSQNNDTTATSGRELYDL